MSEGTVVPFPGAVLVRTGWPPPPDRHPAACFFAEIDSASTKRAYASALRSLMRVCCVELGNAVTDRSQVAAISGAVLVQIAFPWHLLRVQHTRAIRARLVESMEPSTATRALTVLRGILKWCWELGYMSAEEYHRATAWKAVRGKREESGIVLSREEIKALLNAAAAPGGARSKRNAALLALLYGGALRRSEPAGAMLAALNTASGALHVREGKGNKDRIVPLFDGTVALVQPWLAVRGEIDGPLLTRMGRGGVPADLPLSEHAVYMVCEEVRKAAVVQAFTPHDLRRSAATHFYEAGKDPELVRAWLGHASLETTIKYLRLGQKALSEAVRKVAMP